MKYYHFQYSTNSAAICHGCDQKILEGTLRVKQTEISNFTLFHFDCFWKQKIASNLSKHDIKIQTEGPLLDNEWELSLYNESPELDYRMTEDSGTFFASLDSLDTWEPDDEEEELTPIITQEDINRIRENFALVVERRTAYYIPKIVRGVTLLPCPYYLFGGCARSSGIACYLEYHGHECHVECLAASGKINIDAKDFENYDTLTEDDKKSMDQLFQRDDDTFYYPKAVFNNCFAKCKSTSCTNLPPNLPDSYLPNAQDHYDITIRPNDLRICYGSKTYHPACFGADHKVKFDAKDIIGYDALDEEHKEILNQHIKKPTEYDEPFVKETGDYDCCCAKECIESATPSKFPFQYTIKPGQDLQIKYQNKLYHPKCLKAMVHINVEAKDIKNYENLGKEEQELLDEIFKKAEKRKLDDNQSESNAETDEEKDEPVTKRPKDENGNGDVGELKNE